MVQKTKPNDGSLALAELKEFASFTPAEQRYIRRSLDIAFGRQDALDRWSRDVVETASIRAQIRVYGYMLPDVRQLVPEDTGLDQLETFIGKLVRVSAFDLGQQRITHFSAYRFLYERLIGAHARPWFPAAFCAAASLPSLPPPRRRELLQSISEAAATAPGWSTREPVFFPEWVEKEEG